MRLLPFLGLGVVGVDKAVNSLTRNLHETYLKQLRAVLSRKAKVFINLWHRLQPQASEVSSALLITCRNVIKDLGELISCSIIARRHILFRIEWVWNTQRAFLGFLIPINQLACSMTEEFMTSGLDLASVLVKQVEKV